RIEPPCPAFGHCGGCDLQHLSYAGELRAKRRRVEDALRRIGGIATEVAPCISAPEPYGYRHKLSWPVRGREGDVRVGLYARGTHEVVEEEFVRSGAPVPRVCCRRWSGDCRANLGVAPYDERTHEGILRHVVARRSRKSGQILVTLVATGRDHALSTLAEQLHLQGEMVSGVALNLNASGGNAVFGRDTVILAGEGEIREELLGLSFRIGPTSFFQVNPHAAERLFSAALESLGDVSGQALDLYTGTGVL
ncbi:RNA methyltransferase, TrmA family, partial [mine drainage metagenome]